MDDWLIPAVAATFFNSLLLAGVFLYLDRSWKSKSLRIIAWSWFFYTGRFIFMLVWLFHSRPFWLFLNQVCLIISGLFLLQGVLLWTGSQKKLTARWLSGAALLTVWVGVQEFRQLNFTWVVFPPLLYLGCIYIYCGFLVLKDKTIASPGRKILGITLILWGVHKLDYPFLREVVWFAPWGYLLASLGGMITALGFIIIYFEKNREEIFRLKNFYQNILESIADGIWVSDKDHTITYVNRGLCVITELSRDFFEGKTFPGDFPEVTVQRLKEYYFKAVEERRAVSYDLKIQNPDGRDS